MSNQDLFFLIFNLNKQSPILDQLMIFGATSLIYLVFLLCVILAFKGAMKEKKAVLLIILGLPIAFILIKIIKYLPNSRFSQYFSSEHFKRFQEQI